MKRFIISSLFFLTISPTAIALADTKTVTINWGTAGSTQEIQSYKMIYSYSNDMASPMDACETSDNSVNSLTCENVQITTPEVYFQIVATTDQQTTTRSNIQHATIPLSSLSVVQEFIIISPNTPPPPEPPTDIFDDFSTDTSANYSFISGSMYIENGQAHGQSWRKSLGYHTTSLGKADQAVSATCSFTGGDYSSVAARIDPSSQTGYYASILTSSITLWRFSGTSSTWVTQASHTFTSPAKLDLIVAGDNIVVKVNDIVQINTTDATYSSGDFCGLIIGRDMANTDITLDNFEGSAQ